jgi:hypothetical protein
MENDRQFVPDNMNEEIICMPFVTKDYFNNWHSSSGIIST